MPKRTINALVEEALGNYPVETQQRMIDAGLVRETLSSLSIPGTPILEDDITNGDPDDQWSGRDLNELDLDRQIAESHISRTRFTIDNIVLRLSIKEDRLKSVA